MTKKTADRDLTKRYLERLKPPKNAKPYRVWDREVKGLVLNVSAKGTTSFTVHYKGCYHTLDRYPALSLDDARQRARDRLTKLARAASNEGGTFKDVADNWYRREIEPKVMRTKKEVKRILEKYVYPYWEDRNFEELGKSDITKLIDKLEDQHGLRQADIVRALIGQIMRWYEDRVDNYRAPPARRKNKLANKKRNRVLTEKEICAFWDCCGSMGMFGDQLRLALLTGQRISKIVFMKRADICNGVWTVANDHDTEKGHIGLVKLPAAAINIIDAQEDIGSPYVFSSGRKLDAPYLPNWKYKCQLAQDMLAIVPNMKEWRIHDLRRTARTYMARAGVINEVAEAVLGHAQHGIVGTYNIYDYYDEKADALAKLEGELDKILPPGKLMERSRA